MVGGEPCRYQALFCWLKTVWSCIFICHTIIFLSICTVPTVLSFGGIGNGQPGSGEYVYFWLPSWTSSGVTVSITLSSGYLICYASDRYQTPSSLPGYADWVVTINNEYTETFIDPSSLGRPRGSFLSFAFLGQQSVNNFTIQIDSGRVLTTSKNIWFCFSSTDTGTHSPYYSTGNI